MNIRKDEILKILIPGVLPAFIKYLRWVFLHFGVLTHGEFTQGWVCSFSSSFIPIILYSHHSSAAVNTSQPNFVTTDSSELSAGNSLQGRTARSLLKSGFCCAAQFSVLGSTMAPSNSLEFWMPSQISTMILILIFQHPELKKKIKSIIESLWYQRQVKKNII